MADYNDFIEGLQDEIEVPEIVSKKFKKSLGTITEEPRAKTKSKKTWIQIAMATAAALLLTTGFFIANPALAANIPIIGHIFAQVEQNVTYSGDYTEKADVLNAEIETPDMATDSQYFVSDQGVKLTASEIYCDGHSAFITFKVEVEQGGFNDISSYYTERFGETEAQFMYIEGGYSLPEIGQTGSLLLGDENIEGKAIDDNTFIGMLKIDFENIVTQNGNLDLQISMLGYDKKSAPLTDDMKIGHQVDGVWDLSIPYQLDTVDAKLIEVNQRLENDLKVQEVFVSPYQVIVYVDVPFTTLSKEEWSELWGDKNEEILESEGSESIMSYEEANAREYADFDLVAYNQDGQALEYQGGSVNAVKFATKGLDVSTLTFYVGEEWLSLVKARDLNDVKEKAIWSTEISTR